MLAALLVAAAILLAVLVSTFASLRATRWRLDRAVAAIADSRSHQIEADDARDRMLEALDVIPSGVVVVNESGAELFRNAFAREFVRGRHAEAIVEQAVDDAIRAALGGAGRDSEVEVIGPPRRSLVVAAKPLWIGSELVGAMAVIEDVSERRRVDAVRRDFVTNISHELKTPVGALGLLAETIAAEDDPNVMRRLADRMTAEAHRVGRIIEDLLALSRLESESAVVRDSLPVLDVVNDAVERVAAVAELHRIRVQTESVSPRHYVIGDRRQLVSAVAALLENACNYSDDDSTVVVESSVDGDWVELTVRDQGIGIPTSDLDRVFERFYRVDRARARDTGGTGLGLAIVRHVATNHGGSVGVASREGEGSVFTLRVPGRSS